MTSNVGMSRLSTSSTFFTERKAGDKHFQWDSFQKFIYISYAYSSSTLNFDIFSTLTETVTIFDFVFLQTTLAMGYAIMDFFIKQYTGKLDFNKSLNPLLKGITYGLLLQTALWTLLHSTDLGDALRFFTSSFYATPLWAKCHKTASNSCVSSLEMMESCNNNKLTLLNTTSAHINYKWMFLSTEKALLTSRLFIMALVWISNFFMATVTDQTLTKIFKIAFILRSVSTVITLALTFIIRKDKLSLAISSLLDINVDHSYTSAFIRLAYVYGIGFVGVYDFGAMSPYTLIDNAVIIFAIVFTTLAFLRSVVVKIVYLTLKNCVVFDTGNQFITAHYLLFAVLPLGTEFMHPHKYYLFYIYLNMIMSLSVCIALLTLTMTKLIHREFRTVNNLYIVGILCFIGFALSVPASASFSRKSGLIHGLNVVMLYLGGVKAAIIMWMYGVHRFSNDMHFWLGFNPTKFWQLSWTLLPAGIFYFLGREILKMIYVFPHEDKSFLDDAVLACVWIAFSLSVVVIFHTKTIAKYMMHNNLAGVFRHSSKYGPSDADDRKHRIKFDVSTYFRQCRHNCMLLDEQFDCYHSPIIYAGHTEDTNEEGMSSQSITHIFEAGPSRKTRTSSIMEADSLHIS